jgi:hypothetical protein
MYFFLSLHSALSAAQIVIQFLFPWNATLYTLGKNLEGKCYKVLHHKHFNLHSQGAMRSLFEKVLVSAGSERSGEITEGKEVCDWIGTGSMVTSNI